MKTRSGHVILPDGQELSYQSLASIAADIDPVRDVELRAESEWRYIGKPMQRWIFRRNQRYAELRY